jgi:SagB-type dehydrogenase family enzyme
MEPLQLQLRDGSLLNVEPRTPDFLIVPVDPALEYRWSRHAYLRRDGASAVLDSATARARLRAAPEVIARLFVSGEPIEILAAAGLMTAAEEDARWEFHDLLFHQQSSRGDPLRSYGATYRWAGRLPPPGRILTRGTRVPLPAPDASALMAADCPLSEAILRRRSCYEHGVQPIRLSQLGEFLWRITRRLPSAGGLGELSFYAVSGSCAGLEKGVYRYDPEEHALCQLEQSLEAAERIVMRAGLAWGSGQSVPQVAILIASQVPLQAWKYEGIAYRNTLLDTGIALQAMYLTAAAMRLGGCALGWNEPAMLAAATHLDPQQETAMAAFVLGTLAATTIAP